MGKSQQTVVLDDNISAELHSFLTDINGTMTIDKVFDEVYSFYSELGDKSCPEITDLHVRKRLLSKLIWKSKIPIIFCREQRYSQM